ncbi:dihydrodipicolinate synthase family protein [Paenibacillus humicola]|uniref:dihydrodipicolinate synthase family protein n=1 Tax=Paenibacillus humicola TaxID=3110540 RepID=UPI00237BD3A8|nr:dihydrodipicolinate synthase family protein [Paenibacillus humicola]
MIRFPGVFVAIVTPFTPELEVDYKRLSEHADWLIDQGVDGLVAAGSVGEYASLLTEERKKVVETVIGTAKGRVPVVVGTAAPSTGQAVGWARHAKQAGAAGIMALPPINYKPTENEVIKYYEALSDAGMPIIAYNNPHDYKTDLTPPLLKKLSSIPNFVAVKEFSGDLRRMHDIMRETDLEVLVGVDDLAMEGALIGATGWIAGLTNALPKESADMFRLARAGRLAEAKSIYTYLLPLFHYDAGPRLVHAIKYSLELAGHPVGPTRPPRLPLEEEELKAIREAYDYAVHRPVKA